MSYHNLLYVDPIDMTCLLFSAGGTVFSTWITVRTKSARPSGLQQPVINSVNATAIHLSWDPPQSVNGKLDR